MTAYITHTGSYLPGFPIENHDICKYLGRLEGEEDVERQVLKMNGIVRRHYAQTVDQVATHDVYDLARLAVEDCLGDEPAQDVTFLSAGTTYAPMSGPGPASIVHHRLADSARLQHAVEISSHAGICTSAAAAIVSAVRAVKSGEHGAAICLAPNMPRRSSNPASFVRSMIELNRLI